MTELKAGVTIVKIHDERSSQVQVPLGDAIDWGVLRSHLFDRFVANVNRVLEAVIGYEEGHLSDRNVLVSWSTGCYIPDATRSARTVNIYLKGDV